MNKTAIKSFAIWARNKLIADISYRAGLMGITADGIHPALPQSTGQTKFYDIGTAEPYAISGEAIRQREHLADLIRRKAKDSNYQTAYKYIIEEVAYTWFNRLIAVRFMEVNDYLPSHIRVLSSDQGKIEPDLVTTPFDADIDFTRDEQQTIMELKSENKLDELFRLLFIKQCNALNVILPALFEKTNDYTELLLNLSVIDQDGVVYHLVHDIPEEDFDVERGGQVEIIGWLYQYYNTEPKDETFSLLKKNVKITKERIPSATQLFTPDWIVRYMVENSLGRLWTEHLIASGDSRTEADIAADFGWKYYLPETEQEPEVAEQLRKIREERKELTPEAIQCIDPCMGSGHICVYLFSVLMQIYESAGYGQREAAKSILENNLYGLDIDDRAFQMAYFAVMMKAREYNRRILNGENRPNLYAIQESNNIDRAQLKFFGRRMEKAERGAALQDMTELLDTFEDAKAYGSILTVKMFDWERLERFVKDTESEGQISFESVGLKETSAVLVQLIEQGKCLTQKYDVTATNPPYMGSGNMDKILSVYLKKNYPYTKMDLSTVFMEKCMELCNKNGFITMINIPVWMFIGSYEKLRCEIVNNKQIVNMLHFGRGVFGSDFGTTSFVISLKYVRDYSSFYLRLFKRQGAVDLLEEKERWFLERKGVFIAKQDTFKSIPGIPIAYWISDQMRKNFSSMPALIEIADVKNGLGTMDNDRFIRYWPEVEWNHINLNGTNCDTFLRKHKKWAPYNKGGVSRKWYGNRELIVNWNNDGEEIKELAKGASGGRIVSVEYYFRESISWSYISQGRFAVRYFPSGSIFDSIGTSCFTKNDEGFSKYYLLGLLNSKVIKGYLDILAPTLAFNPGSVGKVPIYKADLSGVSVVEELVKDNIDISKRDWDEKELSWDFSQHPLVSSLFIDGSGLLERTFDNWCVFKREEYSRLKNNEERINEIVSEWYGATEEYDATVDVEDISIQTADLEKDIKSLLSYAVGCMFGRYTLKKKGLIYAGGDWSISNYEGFMPDKDNVIPITDEEYLEDDIISRLCDWLKDIFGQNSLEQNLDYIARAISSKGGTARDIIRNYFLTDFYKDHCLNYSVNLGGKRPIYWLFDSGKQNGFKALIYLHRYNADTIGNLRIDYLHRMQRIYESEIGRMQDMIDHNTNAREIGQATKRKDKLTKQLKECREYDEKLAHLALSRIELDLDDGVKVNYRKLQTANDGKFYEVLADSKNIMAKK